MQRLAFARAIAPLGRCLTLAAVGASTTLIAAPMAVAGFIDVDGFVNADDFVDADDYSDCARDLQDAGIDTARAVDVCAAAFSPEDVAECVTDIQDGTSIAADAALTGCLRVRRPEEMAECVEDVDGAFDQTFSDEALAYCTRSLLPARFSDCVTGLQDATAAEPLSIMDQCVEADYVVQELFIPGIETPEATSPDVSIPEVDFDSDSDVIVP